MYNIAVHGVVVTIDNGQSGIVGVLDYVPPNDVIVASYPDPAAALIGTGLGDVIVGYGVISYEGSSFKVIDYGEITTPANLEMSKRLKIIYDRLCEIINIHSPDFVSVEELFFNTNVKTAIAVGHGRGVILLAAANSGLPIYEYTPLQVKQAVVGYGRADKNQVQQMVKAILCLPQIPKPDDVADALAMAICCAHSYKNSRIYENK